MVQLAAQYQAAIVGAGPAGSCAAHSLLLSGADGIALIDRETFPRDKCCGDGLGVGVIDVLRRLDLSHTLDGHDRLAKISINFHDKARVAIDTEKSVRPSPLGYVITRLEFDDALVRAALQRGATDFTGWNLENAEWTGSLWSLTLARGDARREITSQTLIGADGARSRVRRLLGQPFNSDRNTAIAVRAYVDVTKDQDGCQRIDILEDMPNPGYGWVFRDGKGKANIGLGVSVDAYKASGVKFGTLLERYCAYLGDDVQSAPRDIRTAILPLGSERPALAFPTRRAALVGDAASMINPALGEGIFYAMYAGMLVGERLAPALLGRGNIAAALASYQRDFTREMASTYRDSWVLMRMCSYLSVLERLIRRFACNQDFCYDFTELTMGAMPPRRSPSLARLSLRVAFAGLLPAWRTSR